MQGASIYIYKKKYNNVFFSSLFLYIIDAPCNIHSLRALFR